MAAKKKNVKLRAFKIYSNITNVTESGTGIIKLLKKKLSDSSTAQERRRLRNKADSDEDLLSSFEWQSDDSYLFGMMLSIIPGESGGQIDEELFSRNKIKLSDIDAGKEGIFQPKEMFYFALNDDYIVTNLSGNHTSSEFQTYMNWLLESLRGKQLFDFNPVMTRPKNIQASDIKSVTFGNALNTSEGKGAHNELATTKRKLSQNLWSILFDSTGEFDDIILDQLVEATLLLKIRSKPKDLQEEVYQRVMSAIVKPLANDQAITIKTKDGNTFNGGEITKKKEVKVETTSTGRLDEGQLKQEMERFLNELNTE
jgi:hypothetical protein